jgi:hypothetical protein
LSWFEFESGGFGGSIIILLSCVENRTYLSHGVQVIGVTWRAMTRIMVGVGDLVWRTENGQAHVGYSVTEQSRGQVTLCAVCTVHHASKLRSTVLSVVWPQNDWDGFSWFGLKTGDFGFLSLSSKPRLTVSRFGPQNRQLWFGNLDIKITATVSWFGHQN